MDNEISLADLVRDGLTARPRRLSPALLYDRRGSELFEDITALPEYYLTRTERAILAARADDIVEAATRQAGGPFTVLELGAGTATKTEVLLRAVVRRHGRARFVPADISASPLELARARLARRLPRVDVQPFVGTHGEALAAARAAGEPLLVLFIGSSIGNYDDAEAHALLAGVEDALDARGTLLLGTDLRKPTDVLLPAYDDAQGITAAFNLNVLARINRELGADFDLTAFRHVAEWNDRGSAVELYLESLRDQRVRITGLGCELDFAAGERIHTESSRKYDDTSVHRLLDGARLARVLTLRDPRGQYALHVAARADAVDSSRDAAARGGPRPLHAAPSAAAAASGERVRRRASSSARPRAARRRR